MVTRWCQPPTLRFFRSPTAGLDLRHTAKVIIKQPGHVWTAAGFFWLINFTGHGTDFDPLESLAGTGFVRPGKIKVFKTCQQIGQGQTQHPCNRTCHRGVDDRDRAGAEAIGDRDTGGVYAGNFTAGKVFLVIGIIRGGVDDDRATGFQSVVHARCDQGAVQNHDMIGVLNLVVVGDFFVGNTDKSL